MSNETSLEHYQKALTLTEAMNKIFFPEPPFQIEELFGCLQMAEQDEMLRLIASAYRDNIIIQNNLFVVKDRDSAFALDKKKAFLLRTTMRPAHLITINWQDGPILRKIQGVKGLLSILRPFFTDLYGPTTHNGWQTFLTSCQQSVDNEAMSIAYKTRWLETIKTRMNGLPFWDWLFSIPTIDSNHLLGQLGIFDSRPIAPLFKMKQQLTVDEVIQYSPEFGLDIPIVMAALHQSLALISIEDKGEESIKFHALISSIFPVIYRLWENMLTSQNKNPHDYIPFFVHPLTLPLALKNFKHLMESDYLIMDKQVNVQTKSTLSFRSMQPKNGGPIIKLPVPVQTTHVIRGIHIEELELGVDFSNTVEDLIVDEPSCKNLFLITKDIATISIDFTHNKGASREQAKYFSFVLRDTPLKYVNKNEIAMPLATLFAVIPGDKKVLFDVIMDHSTQGKSEAKTTFVETYLRAILDCLLSMFFKFGFMPEAHQQNINVVFDKNGALKKFLYHDNVGGTAVYIPYFKHSKLYSDKYLCLPFARTEPQRVILQFVHATLSAHIIPLINVLSETMGFDREKLSSIVIHLFQEHVHQARNAMETMSPCKKEALSILVNAFEDNVLNTSKLPAKRMLSRFYLQSQIEGWGQAPNQFDLDNHAIPPDGEIANIFLSDA